MLDLGALKENTYTFKDGDNIISTYTISQNTLEFISSKDATIEEKVDCVLRNMLSKEHYDKYSKETEPIKVALVTDYLNFHTERLNRGYPSPSDSE